MSRAISDIFDSIVTEKQSFTSLDGLSEGASTAATPYKRLVSDISSGSKVAVWRLWIYLFAVASWVLENLFDVFRTEIDDKAQQVKIGVEEWYLTIIYAFQYGYDLERINGTWQYATIDEAAKIIKRAAIVETSKGLRVKVSKIDSAGKPVPLTTDEFLAFKAYMKKVKIAGTNIIVISDVADKLYFNLDVYYNALVGYAAVKSAIEAAINEVYLANLNYNGTFNVNKFIDAMQAVTGVDDVYPRSIKAQYGEYDYVDIVRQYQPNAGFMEVDGGVPLSTETVLPDGSVQTVNDSNVIITYIANA